MGFPKILVLTARVAAVGPGVALKTIVCVTRTPFIVPSLLERWPAMLRLDVSPAHGRAPATTQPAEDGGGGLAQDEKQEGPLLDGLLATW